MPRLSKIDRPKPITVNVPDSILTKVRLELYSEIEGKVPYGALSNLTADLYCDWLKARGVIV